MINRVDLDALADAIEWVSAGADLGVAAYVCRSDGRILWTGEGVEDDLPDDLDDEEAYVPVPHRNELELGNALAIGFVARHLPDSLAEVGGYFRKRGAYSRFKSLLDEIGKLDEWHRYEQAMTEERLKAWCIENGFTAVAGK